MVTTFESPAPVLARRARLRCTAHQIDVHRDSDDFGPRGIDHQQLGLRCHIGLREELDPRLESAT